MSIGSGTRLGPYEILSPLGAGGMGEVYRARDTKLHREVAIKVLPADVASSPERLQRFEREATTVAALNHPNIVTIFGIEESGDHRFIAMELVEGDALDRMIAPGGMPLAKIFDIAVPLADALAAAHDKGIVHRDLKPANVMVTKEGRVKVLDFGLAKLTAIGQVASSPDDVTMQAPLTGRGMLLGTVPYMSPEQLKSKPVDHRSDIFSLGIMLYEMASGMRPFTGDDSATVTSAILRDTPRPVQELNSVLPRHFGRIIEHCLEKDAEHRYQSAKDVRNELRALRKEVDSGSDISESVSTPATSVVPPASTPSTTSSGSAMSAPAKRGELWIGVGVIGIILIAGFWFMRFGNRSNTSATRTDHPDSSAITSLAVLPFANDSGDTDADFLCDGIAESVINSLTSIPELHVISRNTAFRHRGRENELDAVASDLKVRSVLTGRVLKRGDRLIVSVALEDVVSHEQLWGERFDRELKDILTLEREIGERITDALSLTISGDKPGKPRHSETDNPEARLAYMQGRYWWNKRTLTGFEESLAHYDRTIGFDPDYALAYAGKAATYAMMGAYTHPPREVLPLAGKAAERAIALDPTLAEAYTSLGWIRSTYNWDWEGAAQLYKKAIQLDPRYATAHHWYGVLLLNTGRIDESQREFEAALRLDPGSLIINAVQGGPHFSRGNIDFAIQKFQRATEMDASFPRAHHMLGLAYLAKRVFEDAIREFRSATSLAPDTTLYDGLVGYVLGLAGRRTEALAELNALEDASRKRYVPFSAFGLIHAGLGDLDKAFEYLDRACEAREYRLTRLKMARLYDPIRHDSRFDKLLERLGFPSDPPAPVVKSWKPKPATLAILPFENTSQDPDTDYLSNEIPANIIDKLSGLSDLSVISRSGAFRFDPAKQDVSSFGKGLGASIVLTGQVSQRGDRLIIRAELIDLKSDTQLWGERFTKTAEEWVTVEEEIARKISDSLKLTLTGAERAQLTKRYTQNSDAYRDYLQGRFWWNKRSKEGFDKAIEHFQGAIEHDPDYALALSGLADTHILLGIYQLVPPSDAVREARIAAQAALRADDSLAEAHVSLGGVQVFYDWDWASAERSFQRAIELNPNYANAYHWQSYVSLGQGDLEQATERLERGHRLDPLSLIIMTDLARTYRIAGRYDDAERLCLRAREIDEDFGNIARELGLVYLERGYLDKALAEFKAAYDSARWSGFQACVLGAAYGLAGETAKARDLIRVFEQRSEEQYVSPMVFAVIHTGLGENDLAIENLERAYRLRDPLALRFTLFPTLEQLQSDPRVAALVRRGGFTPIRKPPVLKRLQQRKTRLAILPFKDNSPKPQAWLASGLADAISTRLGRVNPSKLGVLGPETTTYYTQPGKSIRDLREDLNVGFILRGSIQNIGNDVRITANLIHANDLTSIWSDEFQGMSDDPFALQSMVAEKIIAGLPFELTGQEKQRLKKRYTANQAAELAYMKGRFFGSWEAGGEKQLSIAVSHFERAIEIDPNYALPYCGLVDAKCFQATWGTLQTSQIRSEMEGTIAKVLALDGTLVDAHVSAGMVAMFINWDWAKAEAEFERAIELDPNHADAYLNYGFLLVLVGRYDEAIEQYEEAIRLNPLFSAHHSGLGMLYAGLGRLSEAESLLQKSIELNVENVDGPFWLAVVRQKQGRFDDAVEIMERSVSKMDHPELARLCFLGNAYAMAGRMDDARKQLAVMHKSKGDLPDHHMWFGEMHAALGEQDEAFRRLDQALAAREAWLPHLRFDPGLIHIRSDPRFAELHRKMGLGHVDLSVPATAP